EGGGGEALVREGTGSRWLVVFDRGDEVTVQAGDEGIRFLLVSGKPIEEPVAWYGPIVMNTQQELQRAAIELRNGTFIKHGELGVVPAHAGTHEHRRCEKSLTVFMCPP